MLSNQPNEPNEPQTSPSPEAQADTAGVPAVMNPGDPIEVASAGTPPVNDPAANDTKPPGFEDLALLI